MLSGTFEQKNKEPKHRLMVFNATYWLQKVQLVPTNSIKM